MTDKPPSAEQWIEECQGLVHSLARRIHRRLPRTIDLEDLIGYGQVGLFEAVKLYNPDKGAKFSTFAYYRIRGAIYDGLTMMSWFRHSKYRDAHYDRMANELLESDCVDADTDSERRLKTDSDWLRGLSASLAVAYLTTGAAGDDDVAERQVVDTSSPSPPAAVCSQEIHEKLRELVDALPGPEGTLIRAAYYEGLSLKDAAKRLGVSKSWASRLHARTLKRLARSLRDMGVVD